jgi:hypothetical protein
MTDFFVCVAKIEVAMMSVIAMLVMAALIFRRIEQWDERRRWRKKLTRWIEKQPNDPWGGA